ncbi:basic blue protein-like [Apium graveolens]|uniref:basic blue protein-like n=1 Tax=Apium graveolens TaxID=4045 RepID=UPI003D7AAD33
MTTSIKLFILFSISISLSHFGIDEAMAGRLLLNAPFHLPSIPNLPFPSFPGIPALYYVAWDFNIKDWPSGKTFHAGDIIVFNYNRNLHNVVTINETRYEEYLNCVVSDKAKVLSTGNDAIILQNGVNYFICGTMGHCTAGMQIAIVTT